MPGWRFYAVLIGVLVLSLLLIRYRVNLAGGGGWRLMPQPGLHPYPPAVLAPTVAVLAVTGLLLWLLLRLRGTETGLSRSRAAVAVVLVWAMSGSLQVTANWGRGLDWWLTNAISATWSPLSNGFFTEALEVDDAGAFLREYDELQRRDVMKLGTHPPGAVLAYWLLLRVWRASPALVALSARATMAGSGGDVESLYLAAMSPPYVPRWLTPGDIPATVWCVGFLLLATSLVVVPTYVMGAADGDRRMGVLAATLVALAPSTSYYQLAIDGGLMTLAAVAVACMVTAARDGRRAWLPAVLAGAATGVGLMISLGSAAGAALAFGYLVVAWRRGVCDGRTAGRAAVAGLAGLGLVLGLVTALGLPILTVLSQCLDAHRHGAGGIGHRAYLPWVVWNPIDYCLLAGIPLAFAAGEGFVRGDWQGARLAALAWTMLAVMLLLDVSGTVRGESERLWIFFNPVLAASAAAAVAGRAIRVVPLLCLPLQLLLLSLTLPPLVRAY